MALKGSQGPRCRSPTAVAAASTDDDGKVRPNEQGDDGDPESGRARVKDERALGARERMHDDVSTT